MKNKKDFALTYSEEQIVENYTQGSNNKSNVFHNLTCNPQHELFGWIYVNTNQSILLILVLSEKVPEKIYLDEVCLINHKVKYLASGGKYFLINIIQVERNRIFQLRQNFPSTFLLAFY